MQDWLRQLCDTYGVSAEIDYQQGRDPEALGYSLTEGGWCLGMAIQWIIQNSQGKTIWDRGRHDQMALRPDVTPSIRFIMARQAMICEAVLGNFRPSPNDPQAKSRDYQTASRDYSGQIDRAMLKGGLRPASTIARSTHYAQHLVMKDLQCMQGPYAILGLQWMDEGEIFGHAVAFLTTGARPAFMDPNFGEFTFCSLDHLSQWFEKFLPYFYHSVHSFTLWSYREG